MSSNRGGRGETKVYKVKAPLTSENSDISKASRPLNATPLSWLVSSRLRPPLSSVSVPIRNNAIEKHVVGKAAVHQVCFPK